jgi:hypothetical protein
MEIENSLNNLNLNSQATSFQMESSENLTRSHVSKYISKVKLSKKQSMIGRITDSFVEKFLGVSCSALEPYNQFLFDSHDYSEGEKVKI